MKKLVLMIILILSMQSSIVYANEFKYWSCDKTYSRYSTANCSSCGWDICSNCGACKYGCSQLTTRERYIEANRKERIEGTCTALVAIMVVYGFPMLFYSYKNKKRYNKYGYDKYGYNKYGYNLKYLKKEDSNTSNYTAEKDKKNIFNSLQLEYLKKYKSTLISVLDFPAEVFDENFCRAIVQINHHAINFIPAKYNTPELRELTEWCKQKKSSYII